MRCHCMEYEFIDPLKNLISTLTKSSNYVCYIYLNALRCCRLFKYLFIHNVMNYVCFNMIFIGVYIYI